MQSEYSAVHGIAELRHWNAAGRTPSGDGSLVADAHGAEAD
jgi:hypothetical protein